MKGNKSMLALVAVLIFGIAALFAFQQGFFLAQEEPQYCDDVHTQPECFCGVDEEKIQTGKYWFCESLEKAIDPTSTIDMQNVALTELARRFPQCDMKACNQGNAQLYVGPATEVSDGTGLTLERHAWAECSDLQRQIMFARVALDIETGVAMDSVGYCINYYPPTETAPPTLTQWYPYTYNYLCKAHPELSACSGIVDPNSVQQFIFPSEIVKNGASAGVGIFKQYLDRNKVIQCDAAQGTAYSPEFAIDFNNANVKILEATAKDSSSIVGFDTIQKSSGVFKWRFKLPCPTGGQGMTAPPNAEVRLKLDMSNICDIGINSDGNLYAATTGQEYCKTLYVNKGMPSEKASVNAYLCGGETLATNLKSCEMVGNIPGKIVKETYPPGGDPVQCCTEKSINAENGGMYCTATEEYLSSQCYTYAVKQPNKDISDWCCTSGSTTQTCTKWQIVDQGTCGTFTSDIWAPQFACLYGGQLYENSKTHPADSTKTCYHGEWVTKTSLAVI